MQYVEAKFKNNFAVTDTDGLVVYGMENTPGYVITKDADDFANLANMDYIWYASPNEEALEQYPDYYLELYEEELDPETFAIMALPEEELARCTMYIDLPKETLALYNDLWNQLGV